MKLRFDPQKDAVYLQAHLQSTHFRMVRELVLDTGSTRTCLSIENAGLLGLSTSSRASLKSAVGTVEVAIMRLPLLVLGGYEFKNLEVLTHAFEGVGRIDGILGLDILRHFDIRISFKKGEVDLRKI